MFSKAMTSVAARRSATAITAFALSVSGLVFSPVQANVPVDGSYSCSTGVKDGPSPRYEISALSVVQDSGKNCNGAVLIPEGVISIGSAAFQQSSSLTSVTIPASVASIGGNAFRDSPKLDQVLFLGDTAPAVGNGAFTGVVSTATAYITSYASGFGTPGNSWNLLNVAVGFYERVSFDTKGGSTIATRNYGVITEPTKPTRAGYVLAGWSARNGGALITFPYSPSEISDITLHAKWNKIYTVTYVYNGATRGNSVARGTTGALTAITLPTPTRSGFTFDGWYSDAGLTLRSKIGNAGETYTPIGAAAAFKVYAKWKQYLKAVNTKKPSVTGKAIATTKGTNKLTANAGKWTGYPVPTISYQWYSCTAEVTSTTASVPKTCKKISKATKNSLPVTNSYKGKFLAVAVTGKGTGTTATTWLSKSTAKVK
jgi:uncharacterized repeat protein (TIGR02543 family)